MKIYQYLLYLSFLFVVACSKPDNQDPTPNPASPPKVDIRAQRNAIFAAKKWWKQHKVMEIFDTNHRKDTNIATNISAGYDIYLYMKADSLVFVFSDTSKIVAASNCNRFKSSFKLSAAGDTFNLRSCILRGDGVTFDRYVPYTFHKISTDSFEIHTISTVRGDVRSISTGISIYSFTGYRSQTEYYVAGPSK